MKFYSAVKKKKMLPFATAWMHPENIMLSEISQSGKDKYCMISLSNKQNKDRLIDKEQADSSGGVEGRDGAKE